MNEITTYVREVEDFKKECDEKIRTIMDKYGEGELINIEIIEEYYLLRQENDEVNNKISRAQINFNKIKIFRNKAVLKYLKLAKKGNILKVLLNVKWAGNMEFNIINK